MDSLSSLMTGILFGNYETADKCGNDIVGDYTVDTCDTVDCGYETAIWKNENAMVIVERYKSKNDATAGHKKWVEFCKDNPKQAYSVQLDKTIKL